MSEQNRPNYYNNQQQQVKPIPHATYQITPAQAQQLDRALQATAQPISVPDTPATQISETRIDVSTIFEPIPIKEQFSPVQRSAGFFIRSLPFVGGALLLSIAGALMLGLAFVEWLMWLAVLLIVIFVVINHQENTYSSAGLALRHQADAREALETIVASNERVTMAKLENENRAHEREIKLRSQLADRLIDKLGGER